MTTRKQYVITTPPAAETGDPGDPRRGRAVGHGHGVTRLAELSDEELADLREKHPDALIEPNIRYQLTRHPLLEGFEKISLADNEPRRTVAVTVINEKTRQPVPNVTVVLVVSRKLKKGYKGRTDDQGVFTTPVAEGTERFELVAVLPRLGYWSRKVDNVALEGNKLEVFLRPLPESDPEVYGWGADDTKMTDGAAKGGAGIKIAIVDTGIRKDHPDLHPAGGLNCVSGEDEALWYDDNLGHGSHCAGIVGALLNQHGVKSYAPDATTLSYRVFSNDEDSGAQTIDIVKALSRAIADGVDLISMSLGSPVSQATINAKIEEAHQHGILVIAATGNDGGPVSYPAAAPRSLGIGAYGKLGTFPDDSMHKDAESEFVSTDKQHFVASFSNFGEQVDFIAPGVAIYSTIPHGYAAWDGTSMACPHVTGMAALALAAHPEIFNMPRTAERTERLIKLLRDSSRKLGVGEQYEGVGCPQVDLITAK